MCAASLPSLKREVAIRVRKLAHKTARMIEVRNFFLGNKHAMPFQCEKGKTYRQAFQVGITN